MSTSRTYTRLLMSGLALGALAACNGNPMDFDLRSGPASTAEAAQSPTANRPQADERGIISYPTYQVAVARRGDTVASIAARTGVGANELGRLNGIGVNDSLREGELLVLPKGAGTGIASASGGEITSSALPPAPQGTGTTEPRRHTVAPGETAYAIARRYNVSVSDLASWNGLPANNDLRVGQTLLIPVASGSAPISGAANTVTTPGSGTPSPTPPSAAQPLPQDSKPAAQATAEAQSSAPKADVGQQTRASSARLSMPVSGSIIRDYEKGKNEGIDISGPAGGSVKAAEAGTVAAITQSTDKVPIIVVRHPNNLLTVYANVDGVQVAKGDSVSRGQTLAKLRSGNNAYVHFEVREGFESKDPNAYLN